MAEEREHLPIGRIVMENGAAAIKSAYIQRYLNARVTVYYLPSGGGYTDTGQIIYIDDSWLDLLKDNGERLLVPVSSIRILKVLEAAKLEGDAGILLRAVEDRKQISSE